jgi:hypothetical protein
MIEEIQKLIDQYIDWLKDKTKLREISDNWVEITTPHLDRHNDYLQIYAIKANGGYRLSDDGYTMNDLLQSGCKLESPKRQNLLKTTLAGFGVELNQSSLEVRANQENFAIRKHNLVQAILAVNDLFYLAEPMVASLFYEDVVNWLDVNEIRYIPNAKFTGKSGYDHMFDFAIPKSRRKPERFLQTINHPSRNTAEAIAFKWIDTREVRPKGSLAYALLNDQEQQVTTSVMSAIENYEMKPVLWSNKDTVREELAA